MSELNQSKKSAGSTMIEIMISLAILAVVAQVVGMLGLGGAAAYREATRQAEVDGKSHRALTKVTQQILGTGLDSLWPDPDGDSGASQINFYASKDLVDGEIVLGPLSRIAFEYEENEENNGLDDDGDGLVDEGMLVLTLDVDGPDEVAVVLTRGVREYLEGEISNGADDNDNGLDDERGFTLTREGSVVTIMLTLERFDAASGESLMKTVTTSVMLRN